MHAGMAMMYNGAVRANVSMPAEHLMPQSRDWKVLWSVRGPAFPNVDVKNLTDGILSPMLRNEISIDLQPVPLANLSAPLTFDLRLFRKYTPKLSSLPTCAALGDDGSEPTAPVPTLSPSPLPSLPPSLDEPIPIPISLILFTAPPPPPPAPQALFQHISHVALTAPSPPLPPSLPGAHSHSHLRVLPRPLDPPPLPQLFPITSHPHLP